MDFLIFLAFIIGGAFLIHNTGGDSKLKTAAGYVVVAVTWLATNGLEVLKGLFASVGAG